MTDDTPACLFCNNPTLEVMWGWLCWVCHSSFGKVQPVDV